MEVSALKHRAGLRGPTPLMRLHSDERLVALARRGNQAAYEALVGRYQPRLLSFCRHMLSSREDAEDVLQEVFAAAYAAMLADDRPLNVRPWLYRIARNRSLNHLRRTQPIGVDSMDVHLAEHGTSTADKVGAREDFRELVGDVQELPETQRTALLLREIDALSYEQIADAMETTVPSVKSLLVRARVGLAEAAEARRMTCEEVRLELGEVAEGLTRKSAPVRRHVRGCERCAKFDKQLRSTNRALAAAFPVGPLLLLKKFLVAQGAGHAAASSASAGAAAGAASAGAGSALGAGLGAVATKTAAGLAAAALVTAGAVEVDHQRKLPAQGAKAAAVRKAAPAVLAAPTVLASTPQAARAQPLTAAQLAAEATPKSAKPAGAADAEGTPIGPERSLGAVEETLSVPVVGAPAQPDVGSDTSTLPAEPGSGPTDIGADSTTLPQDPTVPVYTPAAPTVPVPAVVTPAPAAVAPAPEAPAVPAPAPAPDVAVPAVPAVAPAPEAPSSTASAPEATAPTAPPAEATPAPAAAEAPAASTPAPEAQPTASPSAAPGAGSSSSTTPAE